MVKKHYIICYDITEDPVRTAVSETCKSIGLERIQYSVFYGLLTKSELRQIKEQIKRIIKDSNSNVHFVPICAACEMDHHVIISVLFEDETSEIDDVAYEEVDEEIKHNEGVIVL